MFNSFHATGFFPYPMKKSENQMFLGGIKSDQWHAMRGLASNTKNKVHYAY